MQIAVCLRNGYHSVGQSHQEKNVSKFYKFRPSDSQGRREISQGQEQKKFWAPITS
jgi:hypothetical protein